MHFGRQHIDHVLHVVGGAPSAGAHVAATPEPDSVIAQSWARCVNEHQLDPTRRQEAVILPQHLVREHRERMERFVRIARHGLETLYRQVAGLGYCVLLTDERGITVDFIGNLQLDSSLRRAGLYLGVDWSEPLAGTCGVGTAIATGEALTVHQTDHFDITHTPLTCTAAPLFDPLGRLRAVLDISALQSPSTKDSQYLALQVVKNHAQHVENANFFAWYQSDWILKLNATPEFVDVLPQYLIALGPDGRVLGSNRAAHLLLQAEAQGEPVVGRRFEHIFQARLQDLPQYLRERPSERRAIRLARSGDLLFMGAVPPTARRLAETVRAPAVDAMIPPPLARLSGGDKHLDDQIGRAARLINASVNLLVTGETGSGKELFAKALHTSSARGQKPFVAINCAAIPEHLIESELFGYLPGSFSGANRSAKKGLIQEADGGTLFLDEIGDMPLPLQARLLRVLAEKELLPLGATRAVPVDLRVIAATHRDLNAQVLAGRFREDLYYRLSGAQFDLPPLRQRQDLPWLIAQFAAEGPEPMEIESTALQRLLAHPWPGNVRELRNVLTYARAVCTGGVVHLEDLPAPLLRAGVEQPSALAAAPAAPEASAMALPADEGVSDIPAPDAQLVLQYLRSAQWNITRVAQQMGISRMTLYRRMQRLGIRSPNQRDSG